MNTTLGIRLAIRVVAVMATIVGSLGTAFALVPLTNVAKLAPGTSHACALTTAGTVLCWGQGEYGAVGNGSTAHQSMPVEVPGLSSGVVDIDSGERHACAVTAGGGVKCWGQNAAGQLGDGTGTMRLTPVDVAGLSSGAVAVAAGASNTCVLMATGNVKCWGRFVSATFPNILSGDGVPQDIAGLEAGVMAIAVGGQSCALMNTGAVKCWGRTESTRRGPALDMPGLSAGVAALSMGSSFSCALTTAGAVKCWGNDYTPYISMAPPTRDPNPHVVPGLGNGITAIAAGGFHLCALTAAGAVVCRGKNESGQLGDGTGVDAISLDANSFNQAAPVSVSGMSSGATQIAAGERHTCAVAGGIAQCWGWDEWGQLGDNLLLVAGVPTATGLPSSGIATLAGGGTDGFEDFNCILTTSGAVKCAGWNAAGQLGDGSNLLRSTLVDVVGLGNGAASLAVGRNHACAVTSSGGVKCWGGNAYSMLGDGTTQDRNTPVDVAGLASGAVAVSAGSRHSCALTGAGGVKCWGTLLFTPTPTDLPGGTSGIAAIASAGQTNCAVTTSGGVKCGGSNLVDVAGLSSGVIAITVGGAGHACALMSTGGVKCWGGNSSALLGRGFDGNTEVGDVPGLTSGVIQVSAGASHACAALSDGTAKCWGANHRYQLGTGSVSNAQPPIAVAGLSGVTAIFAINHHSCALTTSGTKCWGWNRSGQFALGSGEFRYAPSPVVTSIEADLALTHSLESGTTTTGKDLVYAIGVTNTGPLTAMGTVVTAALPPSATYVWATPGCTHTAGTVTCTLGTFEVGGSRQLRIVVRATQVGTFTTTATASTTRGDGNAANDSVASNVPITASPAGVPVLRYRLYSDVTKEHHFTTDLNEYTVLGGNGAWVQEGTVGKVLNNPGSYNGVQAVPYYRLYDTSTRWHHWTTDANEYYTLRGLPWWNAEGVDGYILPTQAAGTTELYRLTYPFLPGLHHWTIDPVEYQQLIANFSWVGEPGAGFVLQ